MTDTEAFADQVKKEFHTRMTVVLRDGDLYGERSTHVVLIRAFTFNPTEFKNYYQHLDVLEFQDYTLKDVPFQMMDIADKVIFRECSLSSTEDDMMLMCLENCTRMHPLELAFYDCKHEFQTVNFGNLCFLYKCLSGLTIHDSPKNLTDGLEHLFAFLYLMLNLKRLELKCAYEVYDIVHYIEISNLKELRLIDCSLTKKEIETLRESADRKGVAFTCE